MTLMHTTNELIEQSGLSKLFQEQLLLLPEFVSDGKGGKIEYRRAVFDVAMRLRQLPISVEMRRLKESGILI